MNKDENKFLLVVYSKEDFNNRKFININGNRGCYLSSIDSATSKYKKEQFYEALVNSKIINKEHTEFVIWYKEKELIKQIPVIFNDDTIRLYSEYLNGNNDEEHSKKFKNSNDQTFWNFIDILDKESKKYDELSIDEKNNYLNTNSYSARFSRVPFALSSFKRSVTDRILGVYQDREHQKVKEGLIYCKNFGNIKSSIENSYRCFRDVYFFLRNDINYEELYNDLNYEKINNEYKKTNENTQESQNKEHKYDINDYLELITNFETKEDFNDYVWSSNIATKKLKDTTNKLAKSVSGWMDSDDLYLEGIIRDFNTKHSNIISKLVEGYMIKNKSYLR